jgi:hypothetical protein
MKKLLAVYNVCGISGRENIPYYVNAIESMLRQDLSETDVVVSGCMSSKPVQTQLQDTFGARISYNWILQPLPLGVTFNHTVARCVERFGEYDGYLYVDSGINFWNPDGVVLGNTFSTLFQGMRQYNAAIIAAMPSNDDGRQWWNISYPPDGSDYRYSLGQTTNMHCQIFCADWLRTYGRILPDIFASDSSESTFSFLCSALRRPFIMRQRAHVFHAHSMDGASSGFRGQLLFKTTRTMDERYNEGKHLGFGYEECDPQKRWMHDPTAYDADGYPISPELALYLKENLFLKQSEFDYRWINSVMFANR